MRALQLPQRQVVQLAEQDDHSGRRLRIERHLQFHHSIACALQIKNIAEPDHFAAGAAAGCGVLGRHLVFSARVLDARLDRLPGRFAARRHHAGRKCGGREQGTVQFGRRGQSVRL